MSDLRLPLFPEGSLAASVITTVWVGVWVVAFFNLRLGWTFSGLVVPGYLVPLFLAKPWAGFVVCAESLVTYGIVYAASEWLSRWGLWSSLFGRDRYFAFLLVSVPVRGVADVWLLPLLGRMFHEQFGLAFDYHNNLCAFGLIVNPLIANQLWRTGLRRGLGPLAVTLGVTYLLIRFVLVEFTNFSVGNLQYMYEEIAYNLLAGPKAYIILLTTAFLASWMNERYAWEYNGIVVPALLALDWHEPVRIAASLVEAAVLFLLALLVLRAPGLRSRSFEGAQKLLLFLNLAFAYKLAVGHLALWLAPGVRITDYFAIGYLLATLLAVKAHEKGIPIRLLRTALQVSVVGVLAGSGIGFVLTLLSPARQPDAATGPVPETVRPNARLIDVLRREKVVLYGKRVPESVEVPTPQELDAFARGLRELTAYVKERRPEQLENGRALLERCNYRVDEVQGRYLYLHEHRPARGWGIYVLDQENPVGLVVEVPAPLDEWATVEAGALLFQSMRGRALAVAGGGRKTNRNGSADVLTYPRGIYQTFHQVVGRRNVLQVRGHTTEGTPEQDSSLWVKSALPPDLDLAALRGVIGGYQIHWASHASANLQREVTRTEFAELFLKRADRRRLLARSVLDPNVAVAPQELLRDEGYLRQWLLARKVTFAEAGTNLYRPALQEELLFLDEEVLTPLLEMLRSPEASGELSAKAQEELHVVATAAANFQYRLTWYRDRPTGAGYLVLAEADAPGLRRYWGTFVFRIGPARPFVVSVPHPLYEKTSFEHGIALFDRLNAAALLLADANPIANRDGTADPLNLRNKVHPFNLACQVVLREAGDRPLLHVQSRTFGPRLDGELADADVVLSLSDGSHGPESLSPRSKELLAALEEDRLTVRFQGGAADTAGYELAGMTQTSYLAQTRTKEFVVVWLSPLARGSYRQQADNKLQGAQFRALKIPTVEGDLYERLASSVGQVFNLSAHPDRLKTCPTEVRRLVEHYVVHQDIVALHGLLRHSPPLGFERVLDAGSQQTFLLIHAPDAGLPLVANLTPRGPGTAAVVKSVGLDAERVRHFIQSRAVWLELGEVP